VTGRAALRVLAYTDSETVGGAELVLSYLLGALAPEIEVGVLSTNEGVGHAIAAGRLDVARATVRAPRGGGDVAALREHVRAVRAFAPHVLHVNHAWPWACAYGEFAGLLSPGTTVLVVDHLPVNVAVTRVRRMVRRLLARAEQAHVSVGERAAREVEKVVGLPFGSVGSVPNGVPIVNFDSKLRREHGAIIGSLGRLTVQKRYDLLVRALADLPGARLVLVGDGPERAGLQSLAAELGVADRLAITGWVTNARLHLAEFDIFVLPSDWEGMPLGIIEAMHAGLPVLATEVGSVPELVAEGRTGYLVPPGDLERIRERLASLLSDPEGCVRMGERGRVRARERFTDIAMARRYEALYSHMVGWWHPQWEPSDAVG
jgi:glycosyltransferase involved in cell wall biosynthesis